MAVSGKSFRTLTEGAIVPPDNTTWKLEPHTEGKHRVLRRYMQAWLPILASQSQRRLVVDGFAGPGEYTGGEFGSPLIILDALATHTLKDSMKGTIEFLFVEADPDRADYLDRLLFQKDYRLPTHCQYEVRRSTFDDAIAERLSATTRQYRRLPPSFVMIDPFGFRGVRMATISNLLENTSSEVYVSFMYNDMTRWLSEDSHAEHFTNLFGCEDWKEARSMGDPAERRDFLFGLFEQQLKNAGARQVVHFRLFRGNRLVYAIFFGTNSLKGCDEMKKAIWSVTDSTYEFRDKYSNQLSLDANFVDFNILRKQLRSEFGGQGTVSIEDLTDFVMSDQTVFHSGHLKERTLRPMEADGELGSVHIAFSRS